MAQEFSIVEVVKKNLPSVVSIAISKDIGEIEEELAKNPMPLVESFQIPEELIDEHGKVRVAGGSGFAVSADGLILTNKHVVGDARADYLIITDAEKKYPAKVIARDPNTDIAILKIDAKDLEPIVLGDSSDVELGETVVAIGNALGEFKNSVSSGIVSGISRWIRAMPENSPRFTELRGLIQTDAAINPGNSGGPLLNLRGQVVGINSAVVFGAQNIGFAIPINHAKRDLEDLQKYGKIKRPHLGIRYLILNDFLARKMKLSNTCGALIIKDGKYPGVMPSSPAEKAGLKEGDILVEAEGKKIDENVTLQDILQEISQGDKINIKVLRDGETLECVIQT